jgi:hypothetical protein
MDVKNGDMYRFQESLQESHRNLLKVVQSEADSLTNGTGGLLHQGAACHAQKP